MINILCYNQLYKCFHCQALNVKAKNLIISSKKKAFAVAMKGSSSAAGKSASSSAIVPAVSAPVVLSSSSSQPASSSPSSHPLLQKTVRIFDESCGCMKYGKKGKALSYNASSNILSIEVDSAILPLEVSACFVEEVTKSRSVWLNLRNISRIQKRDLLRTAGIIFTPTLHFETGVLPLVEPPASEDLDAEHIACGLQSIFLLATGGNLSEVFSYVPPSLSGELQKIWTSSDSQEKEDLLTACLTVLKSYAVKGKKVLVPIHAAGHWTLLVITFDGDAKVSSWRYYETLNEVREACMSFAQRVLEIFGRKEPVVRTNDCRQSGSSCGYWILYYACEEARASLGEGRGGGSWPPDAVKAYKKQFGIFITSLRQELDKFSSEQKALNERSEKTMFAIEKKISAESLQAKLALLEAELSAKAQKLLLHDPLYEQGLSSENILHLKSLQRHSPGVCSRCRWKHGCLSCDWRHARIFYMKKMFKDQELQQWKSASAVTLLKGVVVDKSSSLSSSAKASASTSSSSSSASSSSSSSSSKKK
jgi:hypothetical protein